MKGYLAICLHAHLPFVKHPEYEEFLEEDWFFEAAVETYLPLLDVLEGLITDGVPYALNLVISPTLAAMMSDPHHQGRLARYIRKGLELARREEVRLREDPDFAPVATFYRERYERLLYLYEERYRRDLLGAFRRLMDLGGLEIMTCAATHGLLPVLRVNPESVRAQIAVGVSEYERHFGRPPRGIWLPECGYYEGLEEVLAEYGLRYFIVDTHCMERADPTPVFGVYAPIFTPSGVACFGRDPETSRQVWSAKEGYPGDPYYREFYRDQGYDLPFELVREFVQPNGLRKQTGLKFYRITGNVDLAHKKPYIPSEARRRAAEHASNFMFNRERQIEYLAGLMDKPPIVVAPYDAELFGHWWFEGPLFLDYLWRKVAYDQNIFRCITLSEYLLRHQTHQVAVPGTGSWGDKGFFEVWVNGGNDYIYRHLFYCAEEMVRLCDDFPDAQGLVRRALNQCARELLLAQASDWPFIMTTGTMTDYAHRRVREHVLRFLRLVDQIRAGKIDEGWLSICEERDSLFPTIDYHVFRRVG